MKIIGRYFKLASFASNTRTRMRRFYEAHGGEDAREVISIPFHSGIRGHCA